MDLLAVPFDRFFWWCGAGLSDRFSLFPPYYTTSLFLSVPRSIFAPFYTIHTMMNHQTFLILFALCRGTGVRGFGLLPSVVCSRRTALPPFSIKASQRNSARRTTTMASFWQGIGKGPSPDAKEKCPVLICPAQLSIPGDYTQMVADLKERCVHY